MRKIWKRVTAAALSLTFVLSLSACGGGLSADDATTYVQGILDENYKGVYDPDFLELIDITENEAEETYLSSLETEADFFASAFLIDDLTDELKAEVVDMYKQVYAKAKYTVDTATEVTTAPSASKSLWSLWTYLTGLPRPCGATPPTPAPKLSTARTWTP